MGFVLGLILADIYNSDKKNLFKIKSGCVSMTLLLVSLFLGSYIPIPSNPIYNMMTLRMFSNDTIIYYSVGASPLLLGLLNARELQEILYHRFLVFVGELSFSLYLVHCIIITSYSSWLFTISSSHDVLFCFHSDLLVFDCSDLCTRVPLIYRIVDIHSIKLSRFVYDNLFNPNKELRSWNELLRYIFG